MSESGPDRAGTDASVPAQGVSAERFRSAFEKAPIGMAITDLDGRITMANSALGTILKRNPVDLVGVTTDEVTHPDDRVWSSDQMRQLISTGRVSFQSERRYVDNDGHDVWVSLSISCVRNEQEQPLYLIDNVEDITERRALRERLSYAALHDQLTALPNRELFMDRLGVSLRQAERGHYQVGVMFLDLDHFKRVNDTLGHDVGDQLLAAVADRSGRRIRGGDTLARLGGDEFAVICEDIKGERDVLEVAQRLIMAMEEPYALESGDISIFMSVGVALSIPGESATDILHRADTAMYRAKEYGLTHIEVDRVIEDDKVVGQPFTSLHELGRALRQQELQSLESALSTHVPAG